jgi:hypothetical protein
MTFKVFSCFSIGVTAGLSSGFHKILGVKEYERDTSSAERGVIATLFSLTARGVAVEVFIVPYNIGECLLVVPEA